ncbi:hypothetical protein CLIB1423_04S06414 [[Candida] railenensis]|uniref:Uncharacterized protein n=1 Tax=[Candida] railenensis TaxID=45579 RepID=A0A9P0QN54_9ASCO|nr:hypothetical protein CLIB1423_04S06414 [[Candida] railenensis]
MFSIGDTHWYVSLSFKSFFGMFNLAKGCRCLQYFLTNQLKNTISIDNKRSKNVILLVYIDAETEISIEVEDSSSSAYSKNIASIEFYSKDSFKRCLNLLNKMGVVWRRQRLTAANLLSVERESEVDLSHIKEPKFLGRNQQSEDNMDKDISGQAAFIKSSPRNLPKLKHDTIIFSQLINLQFNRKEFLRSKCDNFQRFQNLQLKQQEEIDLQLESLEKDNKSKNELRAEECEEELRNVLEKVDRSTDEFKVGEPVSDGSPNMESCVEVSSRFPREALKRKYKKPGVQIELHSPNKVGKYIPQVLAGANKESEFNFSPPRYTTHARLPTTMVPPAANFNKPIFPLIPRTMTGENEFKLLCPQIQFKTNNPLRSERSYANNLINSRYGGKSIDFESIEKLNSNCF